MNPLYFKINLNKYGEMRRKIEQDKSVFRNTALAFFIITALLYGYVIFLNINLNNKIDSRRTLLRNIRSEIESYHVSGKFLSSNDLKRLSKISTERIFWAKKLVAISEQTTDKIAITHFSFKNDVLRLYGITKLDRDEKEFDLINEFIANLKMKEQISTDFPDIKIVRSTRDVEKEVEILRFQIDLVAQSFDERGL
ncbi:MAG: hypothetical protein APR54_00910 [Candidatus Cloacimonas sp. SDB]|nr:MAG: hypothetical protein APR54_00910 [Candidatus Cloacimonas sp. SDB]